MYALMTSQSGLPIVVSTKSNEYPHLVMAGYTLRERGTKRRMQDIADELTVEFWEQDLERETVNHYGNSTQRSPFAPFS